MLKAVSAWLAVARMSSACCACKAVGFVAVIRLLTNKAMETNRRMMFSLNGFEITANLTLSQGIGNLPESVAIAAQI